MVAEPELPAEAGVVEGADDVVTPLAEVGPPVVVGRDDVDRPQDRGRGRRADAVIMSSSLRLLPAKDFLAERSVVSALPERIKVMLNVSAP